MGAIDGLSQRSMGAIWSFPRSYPKIDGCNCTHYIPLKLPHKGIEIITIRINGNGLLMQNVILKGTFFSQVLYVQFPKMNIIPY